MPRPSETASPTPGGAPEASECVVGRWSLDTVDMAAQLLQTVRDGGAPYESSGAQGEVTLELSPDGVARYASEVLYRLNGSTANGELSVEVVQSGDAAGAWGWEDPASDTLRFTEWTSDVASSSHVRAGEVELDTDFAWPDAAFGSRPLTVTCEPGVLTTASADSPFIMRWTR
jgi:hypothetical protein